MRRSFITLATATIFIAGAPFMGASAVAAPFVAPAAIRAATDSVNIVENVQFFWSGHNYCWYDDGWHGPGWYWCDMYLQPGIGWGGGYGWHHWRGGHPHSYYQGRGGHVGGAATRSGHVGGAATRSGHVGGAVTGSGHVGGAVTRSSHVGGAVTGSGHVGRAVTRSGGGRGGGGKGGGGGKK